MQQPCSNPSESPETLRNAPMDKYGYLQVFCKLQNAPATIVPPLHGGGRGFESHRLHPVI